MAATVYDYRTNEELGTVNDEVYLLYCRNLLSVDVMGVPGVDYGYPDNNIYMRGDVLEDRAKRDAEVVELVKAALEMADGVTYVDVGCREIEVEASEELRSVLKELAEKLGVE